MRIEVEEKKKMDGNRSRWGFYRNKITAIFNVMRAKHFSVVTNRTVQVSVRGRLGPVYLLYGMSKARKMAEQDIIGVLPESVVDGLSNGNIEGVKEALNIK